MQGHSICQFSPQSSTTTCQRYRQREYNAGPSVTENNLKCWASVRFMNGHLEPPALIGCLLLSCTSDRLGSYLEKKNAKIIRTIPNIQLVSVDNSPVISSHYSSSFRNFCCIHSRSSSHLWLLLTSNTQLAITKACGRRLLSFITLQRRIRQWKEFSELRVPSVLDGDKGLNNGLWHYAPHITLHFPPIVPLALLTCIVLRDILRTW